MKYIVLVGDGMADWPVEELGGRTPLDVAKIPNMNFIVKNGILGRVRTIPPKMSAASDVANLSILGYDPVKYYTGRGPLEAANLGIELKEREIAFRCNLVTVEKDRMVDYSAGHITTKEASLLINELDRNLGRDTITFHPGVSYRNLLIIKDINLDVRCTPPHDITGKKITRYLPRGEGSPVLLDLMRKSQELLAKHEINQVRIDLGENPANMIWPWGWGKKPNMPSFKEKFGLSGCVISAVDLIKGIGKTIRLEAIEVPGATGYYDTNYLGKAEYALSALRSKDFVFIHVEAPDEAGHNGDLRAKISTIERFDHFVVGTVLKYVKSRKNLRIMVLSDHATPLSVKTHTKDEVGFAIFGEDVTPDEFEKFSEKEASRSKLSFKNGFELMEYFLSERK